MASFGEEGAATYDVPRGDEARPRPACSSWPVMIARLWAKPGGDQISVVQGDMADVPVSGRYRLVFLVFNTFYNLLTQDDQVRCFENVAGHLEDDGVFLLEAGMAGPKYRLDQQ